MNTLNCDACDYDSKEKNLMFVHIGLKHRLLQQFLPEILHEVLFKQQPQVRQKMDTSQEDQNYYEISKPQKEFYAHFSSWNKCFQLAKKANLEDVENKKIKKRLVFINYK